VLEATEIQRHRTAIHDFLRQHIRLFDQDSEISLNVLDVLEGHPTRAVLGTNLSTEQIQRLEQLTFHYSLFNSLALDHQTKQVFVSRYAATSDSTSQASIFQISPSEPRSHLFPTVWQQFAAQIRGGFFHILSGVDHVLFLLCLVLTLQTWRQTVVTTLAFTASHALSLLASSWWSLSIPLIEGGIALSIMLMACMNLYAMPYIQSVPRWFWAGSLGLLHGLGFASDLSSTLPAHSVSWMILLGLNTGIQLGQLTLLLPALWLLKQAKHLQTMLVTCLSLIALALGTWLLLERIF
jgi:hypothetical protein